MNSRGCGPDGTAGSAAAGAATPSATAITDHTRQTPESATAASLRSTARFYARGRASHATFTAQICRPIAGEIAAARGGGERSILAPVQLEDKIVDGRDAALAESQQREDIDERGAETMPDAVAEAVHDGG